MIQLKPKEMLGTIAKYIAISFAVQSGIDATLAPIAGGAIEGVIKGINFENIPKTVPQKLNDMIKSGVCDTLQSVAPHLPSEFENELANKVFHMEMIEQYLVDNDPVSSLEAAIIVAFRESEIYDTETIDTRNIAETLISKINNMIVNDHEITVLATYFTVSNIDDKVDANFKAVTDVVIPMLREVHNTIVPDVTASVSADELPLSIVVLCQEIVQVKMRILSPLV